MYLGCCRGQRPKLPDNVWNLRCRLSSLLQEVICLSAKLELLSGTVQFYCLKSWNMHWSHYKTATYRCLLPSLLSLLSMDPVVLDQDAIIKGFSSHLCCLFVLVWISLCLLSWDLKILKPSHYYSIIFQFYSAWPKLCKAWRKFSVLLKVIALLLFMLFLNSIQVDLNHQ